MPYVERWMRGGLFSEVQWVRVEGWPINRSLLLLGIRLTNDQDAYKWKGKAEGGI